MERIIQKNNKKEEPDNAEQIKKNFINKLKEWNKNKQ